MFSKRIKNCTFQLIICMALLLSGCMQIRLLTYPPSFTWIGEEDVQTTMHAMANNLRTLDTLVAEELNPGSNQESIVKVLSDIEYMMASLSVQTPNPDIHPEQLPATNHLLIDEHVDEFLESVYRAKIQAEGTPPNYFGVGKLTGSCSGCHRYR